MTVDDRIAVEGVGVATSVGLSAVQTLTSVRAGVSRIWEVAWSGTDSNPYRGGFLPAEIMPGLHRKVRDVEADTPVARLLQLGGAALDDLASRLHEKHRTPPVVVGISSRFDQIGSNRAAFLDNLMRQSQVKLNLRASEVVVGGREAGLKAIHRACERLANGEKGPIVAGGIDSFLDYSTLWDLDTQGRILNNNNPDGFLPGEGAGFALLCRADPDSGVSAGGALATVMSMSSGFEPGHIGSDEPMRGDGLTTVLRSLLAEVPAEMLPCRHVYADINGESLAAKEWAIAMMRNRSALGEDVQLLHPAENFGDAGAANGPIMLGLAACSMAKEPKPTPALIACCGETGPRLALCLADATAVN